MPLVEGVDYCVWTKAVLVAGPLAYESLEEAYQNVSVGHVEPTELLMAPATCARIRNWLLLLSHPDRAADTFNRAHIRVAPVRLPENVLWFAGGSQDGFLMLTD